MFALCSYRVEVDPVNNLSLCRYFILDLVEIARKTCFYGVLLSSSGFGPPTSKGGAGSLKYFSGSFSRSASLYL